MIITVQDYKEIRQRFLAGESQRHIAKSLGITRNTVAKYCDGSAVPWEEKHRSGILLSSTMKLLPSSLPVFRKIRKQVLRNRGIQPNGSMTVLWKNAGSLAVNPRSDARSARSGQGCPKLLSLSSMTQERPSRSTGEKQISLTMAKGKGSIFSAPGCASAAGL